MVKLRYILLVTGPPYGTQNASSALLFARALLKLNQQIESIFFYQDGVLNANHLNIPPNDEINMVIEWQQLHKKNNVVLNVCVAAALRRGILDREESIRFQLLNNMSSSFKLTSLGELTKAIISCDRLIQF